MIWWSLIVVAGALVGLIGGQLSLRVRFQGARERRPIERWVIMCAGTAVLGYGLVTADCLASKRCFVPQRAGEKTATGAELAGSFR